MTAPADLEALSRIQDEIIRFSRDQVGGKVDWFYIQGKVTDNGSGKVTMSQGSLAFAVIDNKVVHNGIILSAEEFDESAAFVRPRVVELHDVLVRLQGKSPVRFRWRVDTKTNQVVSDWTYYDDLTVEEREGDSWEHWEGDLAWEAEVEAELADQ